MRKNQPTPVGSGPFRFGCDGSDSRLPPSGETAHPAGCMALAGDTAIPTPEGWIPLDQIAAGRMVFDQRGSPCTVVAVCHRQPEPVFRVAFDDQSCLLAGAGQPWVTATHRLRHRTHIGNFAIDDWAWDFAPPTTEQIRSSLIHRRGSLVEAMHSVPLAMPLVLPGQELPIDPYLLGLWLGDGSSGSPVITCHRDDEAHYFLKARHAGEKWRVMNNRNGVLSCSLARGPHPLFHTRLRELELLNNKHVPPMYLRASIAQRLDLLRGLMDSDGCIGHRGGQAEFTSILQRLARDTFELVLTLGQKATLREGEAKLNGIRISEKWRVTFTPTVGVFLLPRKADVLRGHLERRRGVTLPRVAQRYIRGVEPASVKSTVCIVVDSPARMLLAGEHLIPVRSAGPVGGGSHRVCAFAIRVGVDPGRG